MLGHSDFSRRKALKNSKLWIKASARNIEDLQTTQKWWPSSDAVVRAVCREKKDHTEMVVRGSGPSSNYPIDFEDKKKMIIFFGLLMSVHCTLCTDSGQSSFLAHFFAKKLSGPFTAHRSRGSGALSAGSSSQQSRRNRPVRPASNWQSYDCR